MFFLQEIHPNIAGPAELRMTSDRTRFNVNKNVSVQTGLSCLVVFYSLSFLLNSNLSFMYFIDDYFLLFMLFLILFLMCLILNFIVSSFSCEAHWCPGDVVKCHIYIYIYIT